MIERLENDGWMEDFSDDSSSVAVLEKIEPEKQKSPEWAGPRCEKCNAPIKSDVVSICRSCGWYSSLGTFVELDPNWDTSEEDEPTEAVSVAPQKSHVRVWLDLMPRWSWVMIACALVVVVESVVVRFATPPGSSLRTVWSLSQLALGFFAVVGCHVFNFLVLATEDADFGALDLILKPFKLWAKAVRNLPTRLWVANSAVCGLTAMIMSFLVIGGLPYERLWDWGFQEPVKQNLMGAVMDRAKQIEATNDDLEESIGDFAGSQDTEGVEVKAPEKPREKADCVILGYQLDRDGRLSSLLLGTAHRNRLIPAGRVSPEMPDGERSDLLATLEAIKRRDPFIAIEAEATWVEPRLTCRVTYGERLKGGRLRDLKWDTLLGAMKGQ